MDINFEQTDIDVIARRVVELLRPLLGCKCKGNDDTYLDVKGLAEYLKVSEKWVYASIKEMNIPYIRLKGHIRFRINEVEKWIDSYNVPAVNRIANLMKVIK